MRGIAEFEQTTEPNRYERTEELVQWCILSMSLPELLGYSGTLTPVA